MTELKNTEASVEADEESRVQDRPGSLGPGATVWEHLAQVSPRIKNNPNTYEAQQLNRASLDQCVKCTICETQCPVAKATPLFSGPKFVGPQAERFRNGESVDHTLDYCSSCGICTLDCPQGVRIAELNSMARAVMKQGHMPLRDRIITQTGSRASCSPRSPPWPTGHSSRSRSGWPSRRSSACTAMPPCPWPRARASRAG